MQLYGTIYGGEVEKRTKKTTAFPKGQCCNGSKFCGSSKVFGIAARGRL